MRWMLALTLLAGCAEEPKPQKPSGDPVSVWVRIEGVDSTFYVGLYDSTGVLLWVDIIPDFTMRERGHTTTRCTFADSGTKMVYRGRVRQEDYDELLLDLLAFGFGGLR